MNKNLPIKLAALTAAIMTLEITGVVVGTLDMMNGKVFDSLRVAELPPHFLLQMFAFCVVVFILHLLVLAYAWLGACVLGRTFRLQTVAVENLGVLILVLAWATIFLLNNAFFPRSMFSYWGSFNIGPVDESSLAFISAMIVASPTAIILWQLISRFRRQFALAILLCCAAFTLMPNKGTKAIGADNENPNIIVIGIDSHRPEYLNNEELMPNLTRLLAKSAVFSEVYTPIARTFPSWISTLSGLHPLETGARMNLTDPAQVRRDSMITWQLRDAGYHTILATDERRFSNLDKTYGFDTIVGPAAGATDFALGLVGGLPLANLVASSRLGEILFPHLHNNRAVTRLYQPANFVEQLARKLANRTSKPIFLATHLCLPHWPYQWSEAPAGMNNRINSTQLDVAGKTINEAITREEKKRQMYETTLPEVDRQIAHLMKSLRTAGHLKNAIVVFLSDHGEGFGAADETLVDIEDNDIPITAKRRNGHGTSLLALVQHHTFIALRRFGGDDQFPAGERQQRFFNYDLAPTLLELLTLNSPIKMRGVSMMPWVLNPEHEALDRSIFLETGFDLPAINQLSINITDVVSQGIGYYRSTKQDSSLLTRKRWVS